MADLADLTGLIDNTTNVAIVLDSFVNYLDNIMRIVSILIHLGYFGFIIYLKDFRVRQMLYLHHVNVIGLIYCLHYACYISSQAPNFDNAELNDILCFISSMVWMITKFLRMYSVLLLAFYRYIAVFNLKLHRKLTKNMLHLIMGIVLVWVFSIVVSLILKYSFNTNYSLFYCFEGDSDDFSILVSFLLINNFFAIMFPSLIVVSVYIRIMHKVRSLTSKLSGQKASSNSSIVEKIRQSNKSRTSKISTVDSPKPTPLDTPTVSNMTSHISSVNRSSNTQASNTGSTATTKRNKQANMALQLILINSANIIGSIFSIIINARLKVATTNDNLALIAESQYSRPIFRFIFLFTQSLIPIVSIVLSPWKIRK